MEDSASGSEPMLRARLIEMLKSDESESGLIDAMPPATTTTVRL
jgi:hypothetical protein